MQCVLLTLRSTNACCRLNHDYRLFNKSFYPSLSPHTELYLHDATSCTASAISQRVTGGYVCPGASSTRAAVTRDGSATYDCSRVSQRSPGAASSISGSNVASAAPRSTSRTECMPLRMRVSTSLRNILPLSSPANKLTAGRTNRCFLRSGSRGGKS